MFSLSPSSSPLAPPVKGKRKQSEEGEPLDPPVSPQPDGEPSRSQSPAHLEVSWVTLPHWAPSSPCSTCVQVEQVTLETPCRSVPYPPSPERVQRGAQPHCLGPCAGRWADGGARPSPLAGCSGLVFTAEPFYYMRMTWSPDL